MWLYAVVCSQGDPTRPVHRQAEPLTMWGARESDPQLPATEGRLPKNPISSAKSQTTGNSTPLEVERLLGRNHRPYGPQAEIALCSAQLL